MMICQSTLGSNENSEFLVGVFRMSDGHHTIFGSMLYGKIRYIIMCVSYRKNSTMFKDLIRVRFMILSIEYVPLRLGVWFNDLYLSLSSNDYE